MLSEDVVGSKFELIGPHLDERVTRLWAATEARALGYGGIEAVARATGIAASRIRRGQADLAGGVVLGAGRVRRAGGGRPRLTDADPKLLEDLEALADDGEATGYPPIIWRGSYATSSTSSTLTPS